jgi:formiminotetrahydrofolate cyclodeaminase
MSPSLGLADLSLRGFSDRLAERAPTPGGGSVAAYLVAVGSGLVAMAFRFSTGPKFSAVEPAMLRRAGELDGIRARALEFVDLDSAAYDAVTSAFGLPKGSEEEKARRTSVVQAALLGALEVPLGTMESALSALRIAAEGAADINKNLASDFATGSWCLWSASEAAALNVRINAVSLADRDLARSRLAQCDRLQGESMALAESSRVSAGRHFS